MRGWAFGKLKDPAGGGGGLRGPLPDPLWGCCTATDARRMSTRDGRRKARQWYMFMGTFLFGGGMGVRLRVCALTGSLIV